jgi:hypothetical protein
MGISSTGRDAAALNARPQKKFRRREPFLPFAHCGYPRQGIARLRAEKMQQDPPRNQRRPRPRRNDPLGPDGPIGVRLRALFAEAESEEIPPDLIELLERLDEAERRGGA